MTLDFEQKNKHYLGQKSKCDECFLEPAGRGTQ